MIDDQEEALSRELGALALDPAPPSTLDIGAIVTAGRRNRRHRRTLVAAAAATVFAIGTATWTLLPSRQQVQQPATHRLHYQAVNPRDPLRVDAEFGWLPSSITEVDAMSYHHTPGADTYDSILSGSGPAPATQRMGPGLELSVYPEGVDPAGPAGDDTGIWRVAGTAPNVNGRRAYWLVNMPGTSDITLALRWLSLDGRWVQLNSSGAPGISKSDLLHIAAQVTLGQGSLPMPITITRSPNIEVKQVMQFLSLRGPQEDQKPFFTMLVAVGPVAGPDTPVKITISPHGETPPPTMGSTTPQQDRDAGVTRLCETKRGLDICARVTVPGPPDLQAVLAQIQSLGPTQSTWTTDVIH